MSRERDVPGAATGAEIRKAGETWTLVLVRDQPIGRIVGPEAMQFTGWQRLNAEYAAQFGVEPPALPTKPRT